MNPNCPQCQSKSIKYGHIRNTQRWQCKKCKHQFTLHLPRGKKQEVKVLAVLLYMMGVSMNSIAKLIGVATKTVLEWVRDFAIKNYDKPVPSKAVIVELDEMWHYVGSKKTNYGYGRLLIDMETDWLIGNAGIVVHPR